MGFWRRVLVKLWEEDSSSTPAYSPDKKKYIKVRDLGYALMRLALRSDETDAVILKYFKDEAGMNVSQIKIELICLRAFIVDFAVWATLKDETERTDVLVAFYSELEELARRADAANLLKLIKSRIFTYSEAVKEPTNLGPAWPIGKAFGKFCGNDSLHDIMLGSIEFGATHKQVCESVKKFKLLK